MVAGAGFKLLDYQHQGIARTQQSVVVAEKPIMAVHSP